MRRLVSAILLAGVLAAKDDVAPRLDASAGLFEAAKHGIPADVLGQARCVVLIPGLKKMGLVAASSVGRGFAVCRRDAGWSAPAAMQMAGKSVGLQAGRSERDVVLLVTTDAGVKHLVSNKFEVPARSPLSGVVCYARAKESFEDVSLTGALVGPDEETNAELYGADMIRATKKILTGPVKVPAAAEQLEAALKGGGQGAASTQ